MDQIEAKAADEPIATEAVIDLSGTRYVILALGNTLFRFQVRRLADADWKKFFAGIVQETLQAEESSTQSFYDLDCTSLQLVEDVTVGCDTKQKDGELFDVVDFDKAKLSLNHRLQIARVLASAVRVNRDDAFGDEVVVTISSPWSVGQDKMAIVETQHTFAQPGIEHVRRFRGISACVSIAKRDGMTVTSYPSPYGAAMFLYGDLIRSVRGYKANGADLGSDVEAIKREMDGYHKAVAAYALFDFLG